MPLPRLGPLCAVLLLLLPAPGHARNSVPAEGELLFAIVREGPRIGTCRVVFAPRGDRLGVTATIEVEVGLGFITLYRYQQTRREVWQGMRLVALETVIDDDGEKTRLVARATADGLLVEGPAGRQLVPADMLPTGNWDARTVAASRLLDSTNGRILAITVTGGEAVGTVPGGRAIAARYYRIAGDAEKELWYDEAGVWVGMREVVRDGSVVEYQRIEAEALNAAPVAPTARRE